MFAIVSPHEDVVCHSKQCCFRTMKMVKARLEFVENIVSFNDLEQLLQNDFFKHQVQHMLCFGAGMLVTSMGCVYILFHIAEYAEE